MIRSPQPGQGKTEPNKMELNRTVTVRKSVGEIEARLESPQLEKLKPKAIDRLAEARACIVKAKFQLGNSRNIKTEIKQDVTNQLDKLFQIIKDLHRDLPKDKNYTNINKNNDPTITKINQNDREKDDVVMETLKENNRILIENRENIVKLGALLELSTTAAKASYSDIVSVEAKKKIPDARALHSVVVTSTSELDTGDEVLEKIRKTVEAKDGKIKIERVKKAKDRKIIIGCENAEEREKVKERLKKNDTLRVEEVKNKSPLLAFKDVMRYNTDEQVVMALRNQNAHVFEGLEEDLCKVEIMYRRKARSPLQCHIVARVSPVVWRRWTDCEKAYIDIQRVRVEDQSPLIQCSRCLAYGHTRRYCREEKETCCHCAGPHLRADCDKWQQGMAPHCRNCDKAGIDSVEHSALSSDCPVRKKWDALARSSVTYF